MTETILKIPHFSQIQDNNSGISEWERKICGLTCIKMCIEFFCGNSPSLEELLDYKDCELVGLSLKDGKEKKYTYYLPGIGWFHYGLVMIAASRGLFGRPQIIDKQATEQLFSGLLNQGNAIIASVSLGFEQKEKNGGHLVVLRGINSGKYIINDPMDADSREIPIEDFEKSFSGSIIRISGKSSEEFLSNRPLYINQASSGDSKNTYIHLHENEAAAFSETSEFLKENPGTLIGVHQNRERFLRYEIADKEGKKVFLRIDPNRIFDDENLTKTILERNSHMGISLLPLALEKGIFIREYILSNLMQNSPENIIGIHTNKLLDINDYSDKTPFVNINAKMPSDSFIQTTDKNDWNKLKELGINCLYFEGLENDGSLSDYCIRNKLRYFTIESGENDGNTFRMLLNTLKKIL